MSEISRKMSNTSYRTHHLSLEINYLRMICCQTKSIDGDVTQNLSRIGRFPVYQLINIINLVYFLPQLENRAILKIARFLKSLGTGDLAKTRHLKSRARSFFFACSGEVFVVRFRL